MKSTFFFLIFLFSTAFATGIETTIDSREFSEIIEDFVEIHKEANSNIDIGMLLAGLRLNLDASQKQYRDFLDSFIVSCNNAKVKLGNYIVNLKGQAEETRSQANHWKRDTEKAFKDSGNNERMLNQTRANLQKVMQDMAQIIVEYHQGVGESEAKLVVIKQLYNIIEDELIKPSGRSFVQLKFHRKLDNLQELLQKTGDTLYTPIITALVNLASESSFSDQSVLKQILFNLRKLRANIEKFKGEKEYDMNNRMVILKKEQENLESQIGDYQHLSERYVSIVTEAHQNMDLLNKDFSNIQAEVERKNSELQNLNHLCEEENTMYKRGINRIIEVKDGIRNALGLEHQRRQ
jgi:predicted  nucleic acid-binding Zn-ribbon protein